MIGNDTEAVNMCFYTIQAPAYPTEHFPS